LSYNKTDLQHYGRWVEPSRTGLLANQLRAMRGSTAVTNIGMQLEFFPLSIREFTATTGSFAPFISLGGQFSFYDPRAWSELGPLNTPISTPIKYYNASSSECFGDTGKFSANEETPFKPCSPYGVAKTTAHLLVKNYRESHKLFASNGILFNHESPIRSLNFVTQKIVYAATKISAGHKERLKLGNLAISRDWGWAPDYVNAMWSIIQQAKPDDFIIATGKTISLEQFVEKTFKFFNLNWKDYVDVDNSLLRPSDIKISKSNPSKAKKILGWTATKNVDDVIKELCLSAKKFIEKNKKN
jgi:GDP-D-mannose dehydratase